MGTPFFWRAHGYAYLNYSHHRLDNRTLQTPGKRFGMPAKINLLSPSPNRNHRYSPVSSGNSSFLNQTRV